MQNLPISRLARGGIYARLSNQTTGFNPRLRAAIKDAELTLPPTFRLPIDWSKSSQNFFRANVNPTTLDTSTVHTFPFVTLFSMESRNENLAKFHAFAGPVSMGIGVHVSWPASRVVHDMETIGDVIEETMFLTFNDDDVADWSGVYSGRLVYNGNLALVRSELITTEGDTNWQQSFYFRIDLDVHSR